MELRKVTAIVRYLMIEDVENRLAAIGISGLSTTKVKGYGEYANYFARNMKVTRVRVEIFAEKDRANEIAKEIIHAAHTGMPGDGLVAIEPVEQIWRIRTGLDATADDLH